MYKYPYGDSQQLNLDWILAKIKDMEAAEASDLETISKALISLPYNTTTAYRRYDYAFLNGKLYRCLTDTSGVFNPTAWQEALIGDDLAVLTRWINAIDAAAVVDVKFDTTGTNGKIQQKYHDQYHDVVEVDYTPVQNSKRPLSSNAGYELNGAITSVQKQITANVQTSTTASKAYKVGEYLVLNGVLYRVKTNIASGETITPNTNIIATTTSGESYYTTGNVLTFEQGYLSPFSGYIGGTKRVRFGIPTQKPIVPAIPWTDYKNKITASGTNQRFGVIYNGSTVYIELSEISTFSIVSNAYGIGVQLDTTVDKFNSSDTNVVCMVRTPDVLNITL